MVGGEVIEIVRLQDKTWANCQNEQDRCAIFLKEHPDRCLSIGDSIWWLNRTVFWTTADGSFKDERLEKIGFSGVARPTETRVAQAIRQERQIADLMKRVKFV